MELIVTSSPIFLNPLMRYTAMNLVPRSLSSYWLEDHYHLVSMATIVAYGHEIIELFLFVYHFISLPARSMCRLYHIIS